jgi:phosphoserine phosphatase RsbU/P
MNSSEKKSILIIDDDLTIRKLISHHLKKNGYEVFEAEGANGGFDYLNKQKINLVLCDVTMEEMDGFSFCRKVREDQNYRVLPFIFVTAKNTIEDKSKALEAGGDDLITKPFDVNDLLIKIQALLRRTEIYKVYGAKKKLEQSFSTNTSRVLLVDDDQITSKIFQHNLIRAGFDCQVAENANDGFVLAKANPPDIIISDIMMPKINGYNFRKMLLEENELKSIPFIFLTSKDEEDEILEGYNLGINDYIVKTAGPKILTAKINAIIKGLHKERQKVVSELHVAADMLGAKVVPEKFPEFGEFEIKCWHQTYQGIPGGDFIDYFQLNENNLAVALGDVMGKKWGAWYFAYAYAGYIRSSIRVVIQSAEKYSPSQIMQQVNKSVYEDSKISEVFTTLSIVLLDKEKRTLKYAGAGDLPIIYRKHSTKEIIKINSKGTLLGFASNGEYDDVTIQLEPNDMIFMVTDGIMESRNAGGQQFGAVVLEDTVNKISNLEAAIEEIKNAFEEFTSGKFEDDISIISIKVK